MKGEVLKLFVNGYLECITLDEGTKILTERFIKVHAPCFYIFFP